MLFTETDRISNGLAARLWHMEKMERPRQKSTSVHITEQNEY